MRVRDNVYQKHFFLQLPLAKKSLKKLFGDSDFIYTVQLVTQ